MNIPVVIEQQEQHFEVFVPDFPNLNVTAPTASQAIALVRMDILDQVNRILSEGGELPDGTARIETIEVTLHPSLGKSADSYEVIIDKAPGNYCAWVPNLPICVAVADTLKEMRAMIKEAMEFHVEALVEKGDPLPPKICLVEMIEIEAAESANVAEVAD